jgi:hypothetical protein
MTELEELKIKGFDIRQQLDNLKNQENNLINQYDNIHKQILQKEEKIKTES